MDTRTTLAQQADRRVNVARSVAGQPRDPLAEQVLAMHERDHWGSARFCDIECCRTASRRAGRG